VGRRAEVALFGLVVAVPAALLAPSLWFGFLYDDALMVLINAGPADHLLGAFLAPRDGCYRPLLSLAVGLQANLFGRVVAVETIPAAG
jgi:hypothetical protein